MKSRFLAIVCLISINCFAQFDFVENILSDISVSPDQVLHIEVGDLDGDGDVDLITTSARDEKVAWFENLDGQGNFGKQRIVTTNLRGPLVVRAADIDGDGDIDLVAPDRFELEILGFINDGNGEFSEVKLISSDSGQAIETRFLHVADIDEDGKVDLIVRDFSGKLTLFRNIDNQGLFIPELIGNVAVGIVDFEIGDIDGDGDIDIISAGQFNTSDGLQWFEYVGGSYVKHDLNLGEVYTHMELADMDVDGDLDIIVASQFTPSQIAWIEFAGEYGTVHYLTEDEVEVRSFDVADINQNGSPNVIFDIGQVNGFNWIENATSEDEIKTNVIPQALYLNSGIVLVTDISGDGYSDLITESRFLNINWFFYQPNTNDFSQAFTIPTQTNGAISVASMDVDEDGDLDVISTSSNDGRIGWFENNGAIGEFDKIQKVIYAHGAFLSQTYLLDADGDGDQDIVGGSWNMNSLFWIRNDGGANFSDRIIIDDNINRMSSLDIGDVDGDGKVDIVAVSRSDGLINLYLNVDDGGFSEAIQILDDGLNVESITLADLDGDSDLDIVTQNFDSKGIHWIENLNGQDDFNVPVQLTDDGEYSRFMEIIDVDDDGDLDILTSLFFEDGIYVFYNENGDFSFYQKVLDISLSAIVGVDFDSDGDTDLIATSLDLFNNKLIWLENKEEFFLEYEIHEISENFVVGGNDLELVDIDNDGDTDILTASGNDDKISIFNNYDPVSTIDMASFEFNISPVPANTHLHIDSVQELNKVMIYDIQGKFMLMSNDVTRIDVSGLLSGMYIIELFEINGKTSAKKFIKK